MFAEKHGLTLKAAELILFANGAIGGPQRIGGLVVESDVIVHEIADRLDSGPTRCGIAEFRPSDVTKPIGVAIAASEQKPEHVIRQVLDIVLNSVWHDNIGLAGVVYLEARRYRRQPCWRFYSRAGVAESINVSAGLDRAIKTYDLFCEQIDAA